MTKLKLLTLAFTITFLGGYNYLINTRLLQGQENLQVQGNKDETGKESIEPIDIMVRYKDEEGKNNAKSQASSGNFERVMDKLHTVSIKAHPNALQALRNNPHIEAADEDGTISIDDFIGKIPRSRRLEESTPYGITMVQASQISSGKTSIKVCVIDTGYGNGHGDLPTLKPEDGYNAYVTGRWDVDGDGHGTHCAGVIGAIGGNGIGVKGVNPNPSKSSFFIAKGLEDTGKGTWSGLLASIDKCIVAGAKIVNMSLGSSTSSKTVELAMMDAYNHGVLLVAAAGNGESSAYNYPASYPYVMSVAAVNSNEEKYPSSQWNNQVEIAGPGVSIYSTTTQNSGTTFSYSFMSGTSMATPHVAGVAALIWSHFPQCSNQQIRNVLLRSAKDKGRAGCDTSFGHGIVQAKVAYNLLYAQGCYAGGMNPSPLSQGSAGGCAQRPITYLKTITYDDFEAGNGNFYLADDAIIYNKIDYGDNYAHQGNQAIKIRDGTANSKITLTNFYDITNYNKLMVTFWFKASKMADGENFWLQTRTDTDNIWTSQKRWVAGTDFKNEEFKSTKVLIDKPVNSSPMKIRFICGATGKEHSVCIDQVRFSGCTGTAEECNAEFTAMA